jgi:replicative DNA helicase
MSTTRFREATQAEAEVEQAVIGLLMEGADTAWMVIDRIDPDQMFESLHRRIVAAVRRVLDGGGEPNPLTIAAALASDQGLESVGGADYLRQIQTRFGRGNRNIASDLCDALYDQSQRRALRWEISETEQRLLDNSTPARDILAEHEIAIAALAEGKPQPDDPVSIYLSVTPIVERLDMPDDMRRALVPYGVCGLDDAIGGMAAGDVVIVGARPGMGKTAFGLAVADHVSLIMCRPRQRAASFSNLSKCAEDNSQSAGSR